MRVNSLTRRKSLKINKINVKLKFRNLMHYELWYTQYTYPFKLCGIVLSCRVSYKWHISLQIHSSNYYDIIIELYTSQFEKYIITTDGGLHGARRVHTLTFSSKFVFLFSVHECRTSCRISNRFRYVNWI